MSPRSNRSRRCPPSKRYFLRASSATSMVSVVARWISMKYQINDFELNLCDQGQGEPVLFFLHYWGASSRIWGEVIKRLENDFSCIAYDHRGWGNSDAPLGGDARKNLNPRFISSMCGFRRSLFGFHRPRRRGHLGLSLLSRGRYRVGSLGTRA